MGPDGLGQHPICKVIFRFGARQAIDQHTALVTLAHQVQAFLGKVDQFFLTGKLEGGLRFLRIAEPQHRKGQFGLGNFTDGLDAGLEIREKGGIEMFLLGQPAHTHRGLGQDSHAGFGTHGDMAQIGAGRTLGNMRKVEGPLGVSM